MQAAYLGSKCFGHMRRVELHGEVVKPAANKSSGRVFGLISDHGRVVIDLGNVWGRDEVDPLQIHLTDQFLQVGDQGGEG